MGQDRFVTSFSERQTAAMAARQDNISVMLCGSGDARWFFKTLMDVGKGLKMSSDRERVKKLHFTFVDIKPAALAKFVVIFHLLTQSNIMTFQNGPDHLDALVVIAYLYTCQIIPPFVLEKLYECFDVLIKELDPDTWGDKDDVSQWIYMPPGTRRAIVKVLKQWRHPMGSHYSVSRLRPAILRIVKEFARQRPARFGSNKPMGTKKDRRDFDEFACLFADLDFFQRREPEFANLYKAYQTANPRKSKDLQDYLDAHWHVNVTLLDSDQEATMDEDLLKIERYWANNCEPWSVNDGKSFAYLGEFHPLETADQLDAGLSDNAVGGMARLLGGIAVAILIYNKILVLELVLGEMADFMDRL